MTTSEFNFANLKRYPVRKNDLLQAWDSADELILKHLKTIDLNSKRILILNDSFGALSAALKNYAITTYTDSYVSSKGIEMNTDGKVTPIHELDELEGIYDLVLIKIPNNQSFFEDELCRISGYLNQKSLVICGAMIKHLAKTSFDLLNRIIGSTQTSLAEKKARLIFAHFEKPKSISPYPIQVPIDPLHLTLTHHSNLFSREKLDIGTRFFLEHIPVSSTFKNILDLGCANGVIGIKAALLNPKAKIIFTDDSYMAIKSAKENFLKHTQSEGEFLWTNCYAPGENESLDLVLCNPPFHQQTTMGNLIAISMFKDAHRCLKVDGILRVIGNSHLNYGLNLKKIFGNVKILNRNPKFTIWDSKKKT